MRDLAVREGELYVVTGPMFVGANLQSLRGRVLVPTSLFKAVYDPQRQAAGAYVVPNAAGNAWRDVSIAQPQEITGIDVFPEVSAQAKAEVMPLPEPKPHVRRGRRTERGHER